jgi:hypothetical protein
MIEDLPAMEALDYILAHFTTSEYFQIMHNIQTVFPDILDYECSPCFLLQQDMHLSIGQLSEFMPTILRLEEAFVDQSIGKYAIKVILKGVEPSLAESLVMILRYLEEAVSTPREKLIQNAVARLENDARNVVNLSKYIKWLSEATSTGLVACEQIWDAKYGVPDALNPQPALPTAVIEVMIAALCWPQGM